MLKTTVSFFRLPMCPIFDVQVWPLFLARSWLNGFRSDSQANGPTWTFSTNSSSKNRPTRKIRPLWIYQFFPTVVFPTVTPCTLDDIFTMMTSLLILLCCFHRSKKTISSRASVPTFPVALDFYGGLRLNFDCRQVFLFALFRKLALLRWDLRRSRIIRSGCLECFPFSIWFAL